MSESRDFRTMQVVEFLAAANSSEPVPGGGSVAAVTGALASSMGQMVLNLTIGKEKYKQFDTQCTDYRGRLERAQAMLLELMDEDIAAFSEYSEVRKLDKNDPGRAAKMAAAMERCIAVPQEICAVALEMLDTMDAMKDKSNSYLLSDLGVGAVLAAGTVKAAAYNIRANLGFIKDAQQIATIREQIKHDEDKASASLSSIESFLATKF
jgi:formiminotetrahydrofolate cyclodeaminase